MTSRESTEARLQRLEDLEEIRQLFIEYKRALDGKDFAAYASLFATDGEFVAGELHAKGRAEIQAMVEGMLGNLLGDERGNDFHLVINPSVRLDGDRATAEVTWAYVVRGGGDQPVLSKLGHYDDELIREDGRWRFLRRSAPTDIPAI
ncbi:MAG TPA: nuclear transport factor 2 family protein [Acidimicrobiales bacterium]|nr:nuclear transport factor 2 family protein [Acidimicrobiales bacterium]